VFLGERCGEKDIDDRIWGEREKFPDGLWSFDNENSRILAPRALTESSNCFDLWVGGVCDHEFDVTQRAKSPPFDGDFNCE
jgi:hypothetical protein